MAMPFSKQFLSEQEKHKGRADNQKRGGGHAAKAPAAAAAAAVGNVAHVGCHRLDLAVGLIDLLVKQIQFLAKDGLEIL